MKKENKVINTRILRDIRSLFEHGEFLELEIKIKQLKTE